MLFSMHRGMTYLRTYDDVHDDIINDDVDDDTKYTLFLTCFSLLAAAFSLIFYFTVRVVERTDEFREWIVLRYCLPAISVYFVFECITLTVNTALESNIPNVWAGFLYVVEATVAPGLLLSTFLVTYLAYRIRSMPFCCVRRRPNSSGDGVVSSPDCPSSTVGDQEPLVQPKALVLSMNIFGMGLFAIGIVVNFDVILTSDLAGKTGWVTLFINTWQPSFVHICLSLIPMTVLCGCSLYFAWLLFRYGNELSMTIYSSFFNPWVWPIVGVVAMFLGLFPPAPWFSLTSTTGVCVYQVAILRILFEIRQDLGQASELGSYLGACWEAAGVDMTAAQEEVVDVPHHSPMDRSGILRPTSASSQNEKRKNNPDLLDSTLLCIH